MPIDTYTSVNETNANLTKEHKYAFLWEFFFRFEKQKTKIKMCSQIPNYFCRLLLCLDGIFNWTLSTSKIIYYHLETACTPGDVRLPSCENDGHTLAGKCSIYSLKTLGKQQRNLIPLSIRICVKSSSSSKKNNMVQH